MHDSLSNLQNDQIWSEVEYLGTAGFPQAGIVNNRKADEFAAAADHTVSIQAWTTTGLTNVNKQKLALTVTPQMKGWFRVRVMLAKPSYTVYVDPLVTIV